MTPAPARGRAKALSGFLAFLAAGLAMLALAMSSLLPMLGAVARRAPLVDFSARDMIGLPLAIPFFAFAGMTLFPSPDLRPGKQRERGRRTGGVDWLTVLLGVAVAGAALTVFAAPIAQAIMDGAMRRRDYLRCPSPPIAAHAPPARWVLPGAVARCFRG